MSIGPTREAPRISTTDSVLGGAIGWMLVWLWLGLFPLPLPAGAEAPAADSEAHSVQLLPVPRPDLARVEADVRHALEQARSELDRQLGSADRRRLAELFGNAGLLYQAHLILEPAAACYENAARLMPRDHRWPYYLAYVHQQAGRLEPAAAAYERALMLEPGLDAARLRLGRIRLELGQPDRAEPLLLEAASRPGLEGAALFELGKLSYAGRDFARSAERLEAALEASPRASRIHYTLALSYRGLGELEAARRQLALRGEREPDVPDPLIDLLAGLSTGQRMLFHYGMNAAHRKEYPAAVRFFREGLAIDPDNTAARISLARFLYLSGESGAARRQLEQVLEEAPGEVLAHFLLAVLQESAGEGDAAIGRFRRALALDPRHPGAHYYLAGALMRRGDYAGAAHHYGRTLERAPDNVAAAFWRIPASILAGVPHSRLRELLEAAHGRYPNDPSIAYFLAALLAASPEEEVRDAPRALALAKSLHAGHDTIEHRELLAMAHAESGDFDRALALQEQAVAAAYGGFRFDLLPRVNANLARFRAGEPGREPWSLEELAQAVPPNAVRKAFEVYPPEAAF